MRQRFAVHQQRFAGLERGAAAEHYGRGAAARLQHEHRHAAAALPARDEAGRQDRGVVDHEQIAGPQQRWQIAHARVARGRRGRGRCGRKWCSLRPRHEQQARVFAACGAAPAPRPGAESRTRSRRRARQGASAAVSPAVSLAVSPVVLAGWAVCATRNHRVRVIVGCRGRPAAGRP